MSTQHTPYDAELAEWDARPRAVAKTLRDDDNYHRTVLRSKKEGYLRAKAEDDALLEAAKAAADALEGHNLNAMIEPAKQLRAAIAAAEGRNA